MSSPSDSPSRSPESAQSTLTGRLPFVGRRSELDRIGAFWTRTPESDDLRVMLVTGEAGIGKSRLVEALLPRIEEKQGVVLHTRIYPDAGTDLSLLLAGALSARHDRLGRETKGDFHAVVDAISRIARLRALLVVIEDIHLLDRHAALGLGRLLEALARERIAVLLLARPLELACRSLLERYLEEQFTLPGLSREEIEDLWTEATRSAPTPTMLEIVTDGTMGNPLAIRSMLREVRASADTAGNREVGHEAIAARMRGSVELLSEGLLAELGPGERAAAERLALLGEVFSREAAAVMIPDADEIIDALLASGIIAVATMPPTSIIGGPDETLLRGRHHDSAFSPLGFTHTLVHRSLLAHAPFDCLELLEAIGDGHPLYSHLPFARLELFPTTIDIDFPLLKRVVWRTRNLLNVIQMSPDWSQADICLRAASTITEGRIDRLAPGERRVMLAKLLEFRWQLSTGPERSSILDLWLESTGAPADGDLACARLGALMNAYMERRYRHPDAEGYIREIHKTVERFPQICRSVTYVYALGYGVVADWYWDAGSFEDKAAGLEKIHSDALTSPALREYARHHFLPQILLYFRTPEELDERRAFQRQRFGSGDPNGIQGDSSEMENLKFLQCIGEVDTVIERCRALTPWLARRTLYINNLITFNLQLFARVSLGLDLETVLGELEAFDEACPQVRGIRLGTDMVRTGILCGNLEWARSVAVMLDTGDDVGLEAYARVCLASNDEELERAVLDGINRGFGWECIEGLGALLLRRPDADIAGAAHAVAGVLSAKTIRIDQIPLRRAVLLLVDVLRERMADAIDWSRFDPLARDAAVDELEWLAARRIPAYMPPIIARLERHGSAAEVVSWRARHERIREERAAEMLPRPESSSLHVTMLDSISVRSAGAAETRVRGPRVQALLATLVADRMLARPLTQTEFWRIAAGGEKDAAKARNIVNMTVHRLRELLGDDAVTTPPSGGGQGVTPRLNIDIVKVDLLEAGRMIAESEQSVRTGALMRAVPALTEALEISRGRVPFPGLYDEFFEAIRADFECRMRDAAMEISQELLRNDDPAGAGSILRSAFEAMPDDDQVAELYRSTLVLLGNRAEAERVRLRAG